MPERWREDRKLSWEPTVPEALERPVGNRNGKPAVTKSVSFRSEGLVK
jgi:hypothetical protein